MYIVEEKKRRSHLEKTKKKGGEAEAINRASLQGGENANKHREGGRQKHYANNLDH